jgi:CheY-like chemotaxis protein
MAKTVIAVTPERRHRDHVLASLANRYKVWPVADGDSVWRLLEEGVRPQLIICPVRFDGFSVLTFRAQLATSPSARYLPLLVYATRAQRSTDEVPLRVADRVIASPIDEFELRRATEELLGSPTVL